VTIFKNKHRNRNGDGKVTAFKKSPCHGQQG
jgi:hypothetical protein